MKTRRIRFLAANYSHALSEPFLDVGCGPATHLYEFAPGSVGLDGRSFPMRDGYKIVHWGFGEEISEALRAQGERPRFKYVWCQDVFEHVLAPHLFLLNLRRALEDDGLLFLGVPLVTPLAFPKLQSRKNVLNYFCGYLSQDHVNFFTYSTLRHTVEFAGFEVDGWYSPFLPGKKPWMTGWEPVTLLVLRKKEGFNYGPKAYKTLDSSGHLQWKQEMGEQPTIHRAG